MTEKPTPRQVMDPESTLPKVELVARAKVVPEQITVYHDVKFGEQRIGHININQGSGVEHSVENVSLDSEWRAANRQSDQTRGFGVATYLTAIEAAHAEGRAFRASNVLSEDGLKVWQRFIDAGVAEVIEPFETRLHDPDEHGHQEVYYYGHARIEP